MIKLPDVKTVVDHLIVKNKASWNGKTVCVIDIDGKPMYALFNPNKDNGRFVSNVWHAFQFLFGADGD